MSATSNSCSQLPDEILDAIAALDVLTSMVVEAVGDGTILSLAPRYVPDLWAPQGDRSLTDISTQAMIAAYGDPPDDDDAYNEWHRANDLRIDALREIWGQNLVESIRANEAVAS